MALIVQKYGGTSMGSIDRIKNVAKRVKCWHDNGHQVVVVVSAMSGETNRLIDLNGRAGFYLTISNGITKHWCGSKVVYWWSSCHQDRQHS